MSAENLKLWESLYTTDPKHTKGFQRAGGFSGTAIKPMWAIYRATKEFGPVGKGWGWTEHQHVIESGMIFTQVSVWYMQGDQRCETGPQWGGTPIATKRKDGSLFWADGMLYPDTSSQVRRPPSGGGGRRLAAVLPASTPQCPCISRGPSAHGRGTCGRAGRPSWRAGRTRCGSARPGSRRP